MAAFVALWSTLMIDFRTCRFGTPRFAKAYADPATCTCILCCGCGGCLLIMWVLKIGLFAATTAAAASAVNAVAATIGTTETATETPHVIPRITISPRGVPVKAVVSPVGVSIFPSAQISTSYGTFAFDVQHEQAHPIEIVVGQETNHIRLDDNAFEVQYPSGLAISWIPSRRILVIRTPKALPPEHTQGMPTLTE